MKDHEGCIRGYYRSSLAWYAQKDAPVEINFGMYAETGGTSGEMSVTWKMIGAANTVPQLQCFDDGWSALALFTDLIQIMGEVDDENITEQQFAAMLDKCGFKDLTPYQSPYEKGEKEDKTIKIKIKESQAIKLGLIEK